MRRVILRAVLASRFGEMSRHPFRRAIATLSSVVCVSTVGGLLIARRIATSTLPSHLPLSWSLLTIGLTGFMLTGLLLLVTRSLEERMRPPSLLRQLCPHPLPRTTAWLIRIFPGFLLTLIVIISNAFPAAVLSRQLGYSPCILPIGLAYGSLAGLSLIAWPAGVVLRSSILIGSAIGGLRILGVVLPSYGTLQYARTVAVLFGLLPLPYLGMVAAFLHPLPRSDPRKQPPILRLPLRLSGRLWFFLKAARDGSSLSDHLFVVAVLAAAAYALRSAFLPPGWENEWIRLGAAATAALGANLRGLANRFTPIEIFGLNGVSVFIRAQLWSALVAAAFMGFILATLMVTQGSSSRYFFMVLAAQAWAACWGVAAGSLLAPEKQLITGQLASVAMAGTTAYLILGKVLSSPGAPAILAALTLLAALTSFHAEFARARHYGYIR